MIQICTRCEIRCLPLLKPPLLTPPLLKHMRDTILIIAIGKCNRKNVRPIIYVTSSITLSHVGCCIYMRSADNLPILFLNYFSFVFFFRFCFLSIIYVIGWCCRLRNVLWTRRYTHTQFATKWRKHFCDGKKTPLTHLIIINCKKDSFLLL